jgi:hypothetical protein
LGSCFSSSTSLKARLNSFFILHELPIEQFSDIFTHFKQKSGGRPLFGACGIGATEKILAQTERICKQ